MMFRKAVHDLLLDAYEPLHSRALADLLGLKRTDTVAANLAALERDGKAIRVGTVVVGTNRRVAVYVAT